MVPANNASSYIPCEQSANQGVSSCSPDTANRSQANTGKVGVANKLILTFCCARGSSAVRPERQSRDMDPGLISSPVVYASPSITQSPVLPAMGSPMHTRAIIPPHTPDSLTRTLDYTHTVNLDLICSIADTYDLPSDSDTYSYISNCLMQKSFDSTILDSGKRRHKSQNSLCPSLLRDQSLLEPRLSLSANNESITNFNNNRRSRRKRRAHSQQHRQHQHNNMTNNNIMTDSNCSTVIL